MHPQSANRDLAPAGGVRAEPAAGAQDRPGGRLPDRFTRRACRGRASPGPRRATKAEGEHASLHRDGDRVGAIVAPHWDLRPLSPVFAGLPPQLDTRHSRASPARRPDTSGTLAHCAPARREHRRPRRTRSMLASRRPRRPHGMGQCAGHRPRRSCAARFSPCAHRRTSLGSVLAEPLQVLRIPGTLNRDFRGRSFDLS